MGWRLSAPANVPAGDPPPLTLPKTETLTDATPDTDADAALLASTWRYVERHTGTLWLPLVDGRVCVSELHLDGPAIVPVIPSHARTRGVAIGAVERWSASAEAYTEHGYQVLPYGLVLPFEGDWRITATVSPALDSIPQNVLFASSRIYAYLYHHAPARLGQDFGGAPPPSLGGAMIKSGAAQLLAEYRRQA